MHPENRVSAQGILLPKASARVCRLRYRGGGAATGPECDHGLVLLGSSDILWRWLSWAVRPVLSDPKEGAGSALVGGASRPTVRRSAARRLGAIDPAAGTRARCLPTLAFRF